MRNTTDMARESWIDVYGLGHDRAKFLDALKHFEALARADEREACARVCDAQAGPELDFPDDLSNARDAMALECAATIRARGNT